MGEKSRLCQINPSHVAKPRPGEGGGAHSRTRGLHPSPGPDSHITIYMDPSIVLIRAGVNSSVGRGQPGAHSLPPPRLGSTDSLGTSGGGGKFPSRDKAAGAGKPDSGAQMPLTARPPGHHTQPAPGTAAPGSQSSLDSVCASVQWAEGTTGPSPFSRVTAEGMD